MSNVKVKIANDEELEQWNNMVSRVEYGTIFHTMEWMEIIGQTFGVKKYPIILTSDGEITGVWPIFVVKKAIFKIGMSPLQGTATPYGGPIILHDELLSQFLKECENVLKNEGIGYLEILTPPMFSSKGIFDKYGYAGEKYQTYLLELNHPIDFLWKNLDKKCRNAIRKAKKSGIKITEVDNKECIEYFYKMFIETYARSSKKPSVPKRMYDKAFEILEPRNQIKILFAEIEQVPVACSIFLCFGDRFYYWINASYTEYRKYNPNNLLLWHAIEWAVENEFKTFDLLGANVPSIAKFKASFGGKLVSYDYHQKCFSTLTRISENVYKILKRCRSK